MNLPFNALSLYKGVGGAAQLQRCMGEIKVKPGSGGAQKMQTKMSEGYVKRDVSIIFRAPYRFIYIGSFERMNSKAW